jgi:DNA-directed RNA polymerase beta' subunit
LASPVVHVWYKNSPSGGIHQLLQLSTNEIDKILTFVKYVVVKEVDEDVKEQIKTKVLADFDATMKELDELYAQETANEKDKKKLAEAKKLYDENKASLEAEIQRIRGLVADLKF